MKALITLLVCGLIICAAPTSHAKVGVKLFGYSEKKHRSLQHFTKWRDMLKRYGESFEKVDNICKQEDKRKICENNPWNKVIRDLADKDRKTQIRRINSYMNRHYYVVDPVNWGVPDYWASPYQFFRKDGDCEDYAIAKYFSLLRLGFEQNDLRIVVLNDTNLDAIHAVLAVYLDGEVYILDNQVKQVVKHGSIKHYSPIYSINETAWWRHRQR